MKLLQVLVMALLLAGKMTAADALTEKLQHGLFEEEANHNLDAAIQAYQSVVAQSDEQRKVIATALFRLGECYRKLGRTNDANAQYQRIVRDFSEQEPLVKLSRDIVGVSSDPNAGVSGKSGEDLESARQLEMRVATVRVQLAEQRARWEMLRKLSDDQLQQILPQTVDDAGLKELQAQLNATEQELKSLRGSFSQNHPAVQSKTAFLKAVKTQLNDRRKGIVTEMKLKSDALETQLNALDKELQKIRDRTKTDGVSSSALTQAEAEELARVKSLAQNSPDLLNAPYKEGLAPLQYAARQGFPTVLEFVLEQGVNANGLERNTPPIVLAAERGHLRIVQLLLDKGADVNAASPSGETALHGAADKSFKAVVELLLARGADVNRATTGNSTALHAAVTRGNSNLVALLLAQKADPNVLTSPWRTSVPQPNMRIEESDYDSRNGATPLHLAARRGFVSIADLLLSAGALVNATNWSGATPLHIAIADERTNVVHLLLAKGVDPNFRMLEGTTPLALAVQKSVEMTRALLAAGAKVNEPAYQRPDYATYPLHRAAEQPKPDVLRVLLTAKPNLEVENSEGYTPLWSALRADGTDANIQMLIEAGANVRTLLRKQSPLQYAGQNKSETVVSLLLEAGADANQQDEGGNSLLHFAVSRAPGIVRTLLEHKANPNVFNRSLETPLYLITSGRAKSSAGHGNLTFQFNTVPIHSALVPVGVVERPFPRDSEQKEIIELLRSHGADEFLQRRLYITAVRGADGNSAGEKATYLVRGTNVLNQFTLYELLAAVFLDGGERFKFPDFAALRIHRLDGQKEVVLNIDLETELNSTNCAQDVPLQWGDEVEIPMLIHPITMSWTGLARPHAETLNQCLTRSVRVAVSGTNVTVKLRPFVGDTSVQFNIPPTFSFATLAVVVQHDNEIKSLLRTSSDLKRVSVTRTNPGKRQPVLMRFDLTNVALPDMRYPSTVSLTPWQHDLWLRDGDVIEIPEKE